MLVNSIRSATEVLWALPQWADAVPPRASRGLIGDGPVDTLGSSIAQDGIGGRRVRPLQMAGGGRRPAPRPRPPPRRAPRAGARARGAGGFLAAAGALGFAGGLAGFSGFSPCALAVLLTALLLLTR